MSSFIILVILTKFLYRLHCNQIFNHFFMSFAIYSNFCILMLLQEVFHRMTKESDDGYAGISVPMD